MGRQRSLAYCGWRRAVLCLSDAVCGSFSGFYLPLMIVLWLLMLRGIGIELRSHVHDPLWWSGFRFPVFGFELSARRISSAPPSGNVMRGVPLDREGYFFEALWTDFRVGANPGILDWYTLLTGMLALVALSVHGAHYVAMKTDGAINVRSRRAATLVWPALAVLTVASLIATVSIRPEVLENFGMYPWGWIFPAAVFASLIAMRVFISRGRDRAAFFSSATYLASMLRRRRFRRVPDFVAGQHERRLFAHHLQRTDGRLQPARRPPLVARRHHAGCRLFRFSVYRVSRQGHDPASRLKRKNYIPSAFFNRYCHALGKP